MARMEGFSGFAGRTGMVRIPAPFFSELLPIIDHLGEMKVTLYCLWALQRKEGEHRYLTLRDFMRDDDFMNGLGHPRASAEAVLEDALERAVARGTLLHISVEGAEGEEQLYFVNTERGRRAVEAIERGEWRPGAGDAPAELMLRVDRPNIFVLYEQNIGPLTPLIADALREIEEDYPQPWIEEAIRLAVTNNARSLAYFRAILERWEAEGKDRGRHRRDSEKDRRRYVEGEFADYIDS
ncbi:MAG: DnaD domain protein [Anaerolineae bacterium]